MSEGLALEAMMLARSGRRNRGNGSITRLRRVGNTESEESTTMYVASLLS